MATLTVFSALDLLKLNAVNLDTLTENYDIQYYLEYLLKWPSLMFKVEDPTQHPIGYMIGKSEGIELDWHSHITAVTVEKDFRRMKLGKLLVDQLVLASQAADQNCYFMDLYVRTSNSVAVDMYKKFGFSVFRRVVGYYGGGGSNEDAFDMRLPLARDLPKKTSLKFGKHTGEANYLEYDYKRLS